MEIAASPQAPALHLQWGLDGEALGTGADAAAPPPLQFLFVPWRCSPPPAGLVKTPHSEA